MARPSLTLTPFSGSGRRFFVSFYREATMEPQVPNWRLLDAAETARMLGLRRQQLYGLVREGVIPCVRLGRKLKFHPQVLEEFVANGGQGFGPEGWRRSAANG
jgi:excisionase family DNA binding protein